MLIAAPDLFVRIASLLPCPTVAIVCGDLVDTESSFSGAIASWKKVMSGWERELWRLVSTMNFQKNIYMLDFCCRQFGV